MSDHIKVHTHLFLVSDDLIPNITPALDPRFRPCSVCLLCSPDTTEQTGRLEFLLKQSGVAVSRWNIQDGWDIAHIRERVLEFVAGHANEELALNVSGGTKPMSLAAYEVFRTLEKPVYYVHPARDHVVWLHPRERESFDLADRIKLPAFLTAHGMRLVSSRKEEIPEQLRTLTATLVKEVGRFAKLLGILNWLAAASEARLVSPKLETDLLQDPVMQELLSLFSSSGLLEVDSSFRLTFPDEQSRFYTNGGWLEEHLFSELYNLRVEIPIIQDLARNVLIEWDLHKSPVKNELDVVFLANNRLYIIECKTRKFDTNGNSDSDAASVLYKLDTLRDYLGGTEAQAMLVTYRNIPEIQKKRAEEFGVRVCEGDSLFNLKQVLGEWMLRNT
jgi:hypothetical protein